MEFLTLIPTSIADWLQPHLKTVCLHEYGLHLLKYCDKRCGKHLRFQYFVLNMIMRHRIQGTAAVFVKEKIEYGIPTTIEDLHKELIEFPDTKLVERLMRFGSCLRGTKAY